MRTRPPKPRVLELPEREGSADDVRVGRIEGPVYEKVKRAAIYYGVSQGRIISAACTVYLREFDEELLAYQKSLSA